MIWFVELFKRTTLNIKEWSAIYAQNTQVYDLAGRSRI